MDIHKLHCVSYWNIRKIQKTQIDFVIFSSIGTYLTVPSKPTQGVFSTM